MITINATLKPALQIASKIFVDIGLLVDVRLQLTTLQITRQLTWKNEN